jgi:hypothetical protein
MKKLRLVPIPGHEPVDPTGGAALPAPSGDVIARDARRHTALVRIEAAA